MSKRELYIQSLVDAGMPQKQAEALVDVGYDIRQSRTPAPPGNADQVRKVRDALAKFQKEMDYLLSGFSQ
ncbi:MAG TPA: hypothetical protein VIH99_01425 [Bdellovibrionota bacterium]|jgi:hypothetical protein